MTTVQDRKASATWRLVALATAVCCLTAPAAAWDAAASATQARSGQRDFDFEFGNWTTRVRVLRNPLSGAAPVWAEYQGTTVVRPLLGGKANFVELAVHGPSGSIEGGSLRLYNPLTRQWNINFASLRDGMLTAPVYGSFDGRGRGVFYGHDMLAGRAILVRFLIQQSSQREARFEQAYSADGGVTWEINWEAVDVLR